MTVRAIVSASAQRTKNIEYNQARKKFRSQVQLELLQTEQSLIADYIEHMELLKRARNWANFPITHYEYKKIISTNAEKINRLKKVLTGLRHIDISSNNKDDRLFLEQQLELLKKDLASYQMEIYQIEGYDRSTNWYYTHEGKAIVAEKIKLIESKIIISRDHRISS
jgi:hypothetical protein